MPDFDGPNFVSIFVAIVCNNVINCVAFTAQVFGVVPFIRTADVPFKVIIFPSILTSFPDVILICYGAYI